MTAEPHATSAPRRAGYGPVYVVLAAVTALEVWITTLGLADAVRTPIFLALSFLKASLVAAFYMHLRSDSRYYRLVFLFPVGMVMAFGLVMLIR
jgi:cytochrome c oxidase subunit 4